MPLVERHTDARKVVLAGPSDDIGLLYTPDGELSAVNITNIHRWLYEAATWYRANPAEVHM
jgi:hypothetical protein